MQEMKRHAQPWLRPRRAHGDCRRQRQDTDDLTQDAPSDQQYFLNAVAPSGRSIEPCVFRRNPKPGRAIPAGSRHAERPTSEIMITTATNVHGSVADTPQIWLARNLVRAVEQHSRNLEPDADYFHFAKSLFQFYIRRGI